jgi:hypothetical protein
MRGRSPAAGAPELPNSGWSPWHENGMAETQFQGAVGVIISLKQVSYFGWVVSTALLFDFRFEGWIQSQHKGMIVMHTKNSEH